jgi:aryl-alcohol dehydrogenase-like predicted oxidoreductase
MGGNRVERDTQPVALEAVGRGPENGGAVAASVGPQWARRRVLGSASARDDLETGLRPAYPKRGTTITLPFGGRPNPMDYIALGDSGLQVSRVGLGTMNFGTDPSGAIAPCDQPTATRIVDAFLEAGGNLIDTADIYTGGRSEEIVGRAVAHRRDEVVLATKGSGPTGTGPNDRGLSRKHLTRALHESLRRLGTDYIDLYQCHNFFDDVPIEETIDTLHGFVRAGTVRYVGCSNYPAPEIVESQWAAQRRHRTPLISLQAHYSLLSREIEAEILPACERHGLGVITYGPLAGGVLAGRYQRGVDPEQGTRMHQWLNFPVPAAGEWARSLLSERGFHVADQLARHARELGSTAARLAIAWILHQPRITSVLLGPRSPDQLDDLLAAATLPIPTDTLDELNRLSAPTNAPVTGMQTPLPRSAPLITGRQNPRAPGPLAIDDGLR